MYVLSPSDGGARLGERAGEHVPFTEPNTVDIPDHDFVGREQSDLCVRDIVVATVRGDDGG